MPTLWGDNKSANLLATNPVSSDRSKFIRVRHLRVRDAVEAEEIEIDWIGTKSTLAVGLTRISVDLHCLIGGTSFTWLTRGHHVYLVGECHIQAPGHPGTHSWCSGHGVLVAWV